MKRFSMQYTGSFAIAVLSMLLGTMAFSCRPEQTTQRTTEESKQQLRSGSYEFQNDWIQIPGDRKYLGPVHGGVTVDDRGNVYYTTNGRPHAIMVHGPDGSFKKGIGQKFMGCHDLVYRNENGTSYLYAAHLPGKQVVKLKLDGSLVWRIPFKKFQKSGKYEKPGSFKPTSIAVGPDGNVFVADGYGKNWIHQFDQNQNYIRSFGGEGKEKGKFKTCHGISIDPRYDKPRLLVSDRENRRLQHFDLEGNFIEVIAKGLRRPCAVSFMDNYVAVAELEARVTVLNEKNQPVAHFGNNPRKKQWANYNVPPTMWTPERFTAPHSVRFNKQTGELFVLEWNKKGRVRKLMPAE